MGLGRPSRTPSRARNRLIVVTLTRICVRFLQLKDQLLRATG
jgi:hypothetical protein